jgi:hypothetical protein
MEEQEEEYEVLESIYGSGDEAFKAISTTVFQYKVSHSKLLTEEERTSDLLPLL